MWAGFAVAPKEAVTNPVPGETSFGDRRGCYECCYRHVKVHDVAHDRRVKLVQLLRRNAVQRLDTNLEPATRERPHKRRRSELPKP